MTDDLVREGISNLRMEGWDAEADAIFQCIKTLEAELRKVSGDMDQTYRRWKNGVRPHVLAKERAVSNEWMRRVLKLYDQDKVRQINSENARIREMLDTATRDAIEAEAYAEELKASLAIAVAALKKLHYWFDTDQEIIGQMTPDERANHELIFAMLTDTLKKVGAKP